MRHKIGSSFDWIVQEDPQILIKIDRALIIALTLIFLSGMAIDIRVD